MGHFGRIDIEEFISYSHDLLEVLKSKKDANNLMQCLEGGKKLRSFCEAELYEVQNLLEEYQKKIEGCKERIAEASSEVVNDDDLDSLQNELEAELQKKGLLTEELRTVNDQISDLEGQRVSSEDKKKHLVKDGEDELKAHKKLKMELSCYASVTKVVPNINMSDQTKISGHIVEKGKNMVEKFEFEPATYSFEICNNLWKLIDL